MKAMSDETRLKILKAISVKAKAVHEIVPLTGKSQPTVSLDLRKLELMNIVESERKGKSVFYKLKENKVKQIMELLKIR